MFGGILYTQTGPVGGGGGGGGGGLPLFTELTITCLSDYGALPLSLCLMFVDEEGGTTSLSVANPSENPWQVDIGGGPSDDDWADRTGTCLETYNPSYVATREDNVLTITRTDEKKFTAFSTSTGWIVGYP